MKRMLMIWIFGVNSAQDRRQQSTFLVQATKGWAVALADEILRMLFVHLCFIQHTLRPLASGRLTTILILELLCAQALAIQSMDASLDCQYRPVSI